MKKFYILMAFLLIPFFNGFADDVYNYRVRTDNFRQIDETTISWDLHIRKGTDSENFALYYMQVRWDFNALIANTGAFPNGNFTVSAGTEMNQNALFFIDDDCTIIGGNQFQWMVTNPPGEGQNMTLITDQWIHVATFTAQLRKDGSPHNFASLDPNFAFQLTGAQILVDRANNTTATYDDEGVTPVTRESAIPDLGVAINERELAGYWFDGDADTDWDNNANWNNVTTENSTAPPGTTENVVIDGEVNITGTHEVNELTVADGAYLKIAPTGRLKSGVLYNDNESGGDKGDRSAVVLAKWDFRDVDANDTEPWPAPPDVATSGNETARLSLQSPGMVTAAFTDYRVFDTYMSAWSQGGSWYYFDDPGMGDPILDRAWYQIQFSTVGYQNIELSSRLAGTISPFRIQYRIGATGSWVDIVEELAVTTNFNTLVDEELPSALDNSQAVFVRWIYDGTDDGNRVVAITDIEIKGEAIPSGILVESSSANQGQLIHDGVGIEAEVQQYIPASTGNWPAKLLTPAGWYWIASPVVDQDIDEFLEQHFDLEEDDHTDFNLYRWSESDNAWLNYHHTNFVHVEFKPGDGYLFAAKAKTETFSYSAALNDGAGGFTWEGLSRRETGDDSHRGWHMVGNPFASGLAVNNGGQTYWSADPGGSVGLEPVYWIEDTDHEKGGSYNVFADGVIPPMKAFFVQALVNNGNLTVSGDARTFYNPGIKSTPNHTIRLLATPTEGSTGQRAYVRVVEDAIANGFDYRFDARFRTGLAPRFYSVKAYENLLLHAVPEIHEDLEIPFFFRKNDEGNNFQIALTDHFEGWILYLRDLKLDITHELATDKPYIFSSQNADDPMRFLLTFSPIEDDETAIDEPDKLAAAWTYGQTLYIHTHNEHTQATLFDLNGRQLQHFDIRSQGEHQFELNLPAGVYLLRMHSNNKVETQRVIIR